MIDLDGSERDRMRHVIAFFMEESETEARARMSLETTNAGLVKTLALCNQEVQDLTKAIADIQDKLAVAEKLRAIYDEVVSAYESAFPFATNIIDEDHLRVRLLAIIKLYQDLKGSAAKERCPSCDHKMESHSTGGCWVTVTQARPGDLMNCPCSLSPRADTEEEDNGDTAGDGRADDASGAVAADGS